MVIVIGSLNMDFVVKGIRIPKPGETVMGKSFQQIPGGKGANQADAASKLGANVALIGCVGTDKMGRDLKTSLSYDGVNVKYIIDRKSDPTGVAFIIVEDSGNNCITVVPGANSTITPDELQSMKPVIDLANIVLLQLEIPLDTVKEALNIAKELKKFTILNPAPAEELDRSILELCDILTPNETELSRLSGQSVGTLREVEAAAKVLLDKGAKELVVTLGERGAMYASKEKIKHFPPYKVSVVDTTAAGDSFNAGLSVALDEGRDIENAIEFAMKVGAMTVTKTGAQGSLPYRKEIESFEDWLAQNRE